MSRPPATLEPAERRTRGSAAVLAPGAREVFRTPPGAERFFGYHDKCPWDASGRRLLAHATDVARRLPEPGEGAAIELWEPDTGASRVLGETGAFNWQQGAMLQWLGPDFARRVLWNDRRDGRLVAVIHDTATGEEAVVPHPVYAVAPDGRRAVTVDFERHWWCRRGYAYASAGDPAKSGWAPEGDGLFLVDLETGRGRLALATAEVMERDPVPTMREGPNYLEHALFSPSGERVAFLHRWHAEGGGIFTRLYTARADLTDVRLAREGAALSHFTWSDDRTLLAYGNRSTGADRLRRSGFLTRHLVRPLLPLYRKVFSDRSGARRRLLGLELFRIDALDGGLTRLVGRDGPVTDDGHPARHPTRPGLVVMDTYEDGDDRRHLFLFDLGTGVRTAVGHFHSPPDANRTPFRCDLHPRWNRTGERVCIDSLHSGARALHVLDVSGLL